LIVKVGPLRAAIGIPDVIGPARQSSALRLPGNWILRDAPNRSTPYGCRAMARSSRPAGGQSS